MIDAARAQAFAEAYAPAVLDVVKPNAVWHVGVTAEEYAAGMAVAMLRTIQVYGVAAVEHYYINQAGALAAACKTLGIRPAQLQDYLEGR